MSSKPEYKLIEYRGRWEWYAVHAGYTREFVAINRRIPANHIYVGYANSRDEAIAMGKRNGWCE